MDLGKIKKIPCVLSQFFVSKASTFPPEKEEKSGLPSELYHMVVTGKGYDANMFDTGDGYEEILKAIKAGISVTGLWHNGASKKNGLKALDLILGGAEGKDRFTQEQRLALFDALVENVKAKGLNTGELVSSHTAEIAFQWKRWKIIPKLAEPYANAARKIPNRLAIYTPGQQGVKDSALVL